MSAPSHERFFECFDDLGDGFLSAGGVAKQVFFETSALNAFTGARNVAALECFAVEGGAPAELLAAVFGVLFTLPQR